MLKEKCKEYITHQLIVLSERQSKITFLNERKDKVIKVDIESCQLKDDKGKKCDFLLIKNKRETFIELKGKDIKKALEQLKVSINKVSSNPKKLDKSAFIVYTRNPFNATQIKQCKRNFKLAFNAALTITKSNKTFPLK